MNRNLCFGFFGGRGSQIDRSVKEFNFGNIGANFNLHLILEAHFAHCCYIHNAIYIYNIHNAMYINFIFYTFLSSLINFRKIF